MANSSFHTIWISDVHLGNKDCKAEFLLDFLERTSCQNLFLVGDIVDLWAMKRQVHWPSSHQKVLNKILSLARSGVKVVYIPGNHDDPMRQYAGSLFEGVEVHQEYIYQSKKFGRLLMLHGDEFDSAVCYGKLQAWLGDRGYDLLLFLNRWIFRLRKLFKLSYWSIASYIKTRVKDAQKAVNRFESAALHEAARRGLDGVVCGHIHCANMKEENGLLYLNDGDWIESCTAVVEHQNGELALIHWSDTSQSLHQLPSDSVAKPVSQAA